MGPLIFVVDDQPEIRQLARKCLEEAGYVVRTFPDLDNLSEATVEPASLILVALKLAGDYSFGNGHQLVRNSALKKTPWIVLLDDSSEAHRLAALESGAADCIVKPFSPRELLARVQAILRRSVGPASAERSDTADLVIDILAMKLLVRGTEVATTTLEFRLLEYLARHRGQVFTRDFLLDAVWGEMQFITPRSVDACIRRIREKIEPDRKRPKLLKTVRGVGYRLDAITAWQAASNLECDCPACRTRGMFATPGIKRRRASAGTGPT